MAKKPPSFVHLRVHSAYSLAEGAVRVGELPKLCKKHNMPAVGITDSGNLFGALEVAMACSKDGIQPITGCVVNLKPLQEDDKHTGHLVLLAQNESGYRNLLKLVSEAFLKSEPSEKAAVSFDRLAERADGLIALTGGHKSLINQALEHNNISSAEAHLTKLKDIFADRLYVELMRHNQADEAMTEEALLELAYKHELPLVATNDVMFPTQDMYEAHDALICIAEGRYITEADRPRFTPEHYFKSPAQMEELFADVPEAIANTLVIAQRCAIMPEAHAPMLPHFPTKEGRSEEEELRDVATNGLMARLTEQHMQANDGEVLEDDALKEKYSEYFERINYELDVIANMEFPGYFLIVSDFIRWSKRQGIPVGPGRGSGAGSVVAWALQITNLDPLRFGLLFERFLNPERVSMPDFDIDFCQERRDEVIHYVQERYGHDHVAQIITFGKLQARAVLRDVGRVLQMPYGQVDRICKMIPFNPLDPVTLEKAIGMDPELQKAIKEDESVAKLTDIGLKLEGLYRHASTHAAGVVIGSKPLTDIIPLYTDHRSDIPTTQYSMKYSEAAGLVKFDFLGLKTLTVIDHAVKLINEHHKDELEQPFDIETIPINDQASYQMLADGHSAGVFQMESAGMRDALRKMKPDTIEDIIALISLYRPGPMDNIPTYIARKHGKEQPDYMHEKLEECLKETFGVIIYQEQVMQIAQILGGYSLGGADLLRRAMGKKIKAEMDEQRKIFMEGAAAQKVDKKQASDIFDLVAKFAGYGFNKSHAAAYAMIGYQTAYLKANYPVAFLTACMNIDIGDTDKLGTYKEEARQLGIALLPPDINQSGAHFTVEPMSEEARAEWHYPLKRKRGIRYALGALKNVGTAAMQDMVAEREKGGAFASVVDFATRCSNKIINKRQIENLARCGAFDCVHDNRRQVAEAATFLTRVSQQAEADRESAQESLFGGEAQAHTPPTELPAMTEWSAEERLEEERDAIGFYLNNHPLDGAQYELQTMDVIPAAQLEERVEGRSAVVKMAGVVTKVMHRASASGRRFAYVFISDASGGIELSLFNDDIIANQRELLEGSKPLLFTVEVRKDEGGVRADIQKVDLLQTALANHRYTLAYFVEHEAALNALQAALADKKPGAAQLQLQLPTSNKMLVSMRLKNSYSLAQSDLDNINSISGLDQIKAA